MRVRFTILPLFISAMTFAQAPSGYYDGTEGLRGYALKTKLSEIITKEHKDLGYDGLWTTYRTADIDKYYENDGSLLDIYSENPSGIDPYTYKIGIDQCGNYGNSEGRCYNREHIVPQSFFNERAPMKNDAHFVVPTDGKVNGMRSNYPFGEVDRASDVSKNGSKLGSNTTKGYSGTVFEPIDEFKGDVARMVLYFATRYQDRIPNLKINEMFNGTKDQSLTKWQLDVLLEWHTQDPVSQREIDRNNAVYNRQKNRNPFVDNPNFVNLIWGNTNANPTPTPPVTPPTNTACGTEDFENMPASQSSYATRTWTNNNITWTATEAKTDEKINNSRAITMKSGGSLTSSSISGGISSLTVTVQRKFKGSNGKLNLLINGENKGDIDFTANVQNKTIENINVEGNIIIEIKNASGQRVAVDNLSWTCYSSLSINENTKVNNRITVAPNPVKGNEITITNVNEGELVKIFSINGRLVQTDKVAQNGKLKLKNLAKRIYLVSVKSQTIKIIVE